MALSHMDQARAVIDIGSNTVRMVIYDGPPRAPVVLFNEKVTARLGRSAAETGKLSAKSKGVALAGLARYAALLRMHGITQVETVATAAVRDAANGAQFLESVNALGLSARLLSGEEEAIASARGVQGAFPGARGIVGDLGGGSLELVDIHDETSEHGTSLPLGTLRLPRLREAGPARFARAIEQALHAEHWNAAEGQVFYPVGGSWRALARYAMRLADWPVDDPHGFELSTADAIALGRSLGRNPHKPLIATSGLSASRLASLPDAAALLGVLARELKPSKLVFSSWGLREGLLMARLDPASRSRDPLLAGISAFAESLGSSPQLSAMVAGWTAEANPVDGHGREHLRLAATMLALASLRIEPNMRAEQVMDWALRKRWLGIDAEGRAMLAAAGLANTGQTQLPAGLSRLAPATTLRAGQTWGLAIRLCRRFSGSGTTALAGSALGRRDHQLVLAVREPLAALVTESILKDLRLLAHGLELEPVFEVKPREGRLV